MTIARSLHSALLAGSVGIALISPMIAQSSTRIAAPSKPMTVIDFDRMPAGQTTTRAISAAARPFDARLRRVRLPAVSTASGVYNTNTRFGKALARVNGIARVIGNAGAARFNNFKAQFELGAPSTEFGLRVGDFNGTVILDFFEGTRKTNSLPLRFDAGSVVQFGRYTPTAGAVGFDRVDIRLASASDNFVITELAIQSGGFPARQVSSVNEPLSTIDFDKLAAGSFPSVQDINAIGTNGGANLSRMILTPSSGTGTYNTNEQFGRGLALLDRQGVPTPGIIDNNGSTAFQAFSSARLDFASPGRVFGIRVGDCNGSNSAILEFFEGATKTATISVPANRTEPTLVEYFPTFGREGFTRVDVKSGCLNFVITEIRTPVLFDRIGSGCAGSADPVTLTAATAPVLGTNFVTHLAGAPTTGFSPGAVLLGARRLSRPLDLGAFGAPGCSLFINTAATLLNTKNVTTGVTTFALPVPSNRSLIGAQLFEQGVDFDTRGNQLGLTTSNALGFTIR